MNCIKAKKENAEMIYKLVQNTIKTIYPKYYPQSVVDFFCRLHSKENIAADIKENLVILLIDDNLLVGTGCCKGNHITRLFVTPDLQGKGYGSYIMDYLEKEVAVYNDTICLDASLAALCFYENKGYKTVRHKKILLDNGTFLVYEIMEKQTPNLTNDIDYDGKHFVPQMNTANGEVDNQTLFSYHQKGSIMWADYAGGEIKKGNMIGSVATNGELDFYYQHINLHNEIKIGKCHSVPRVLEDGKIELSEQWEWLNGDKSKGVSIVKEK